MNPIDKNTINDFENLTSSDTHVRSIRNATFRNNLIEVAMDWDHYRKIDHSFSDVINGEMPITNQKSSGRCWGFAGLNLFRIYLGRKYSIKDFQFSQSYFMFWDKLEKSNYFLESIIKTAKVRTLYDGVQKAGLKSVLWDSVDDNGIDLGTGFYFYTIKTGTDFKKGRMLLLK